MSDNSRCGDQFAKRLATAHLDLLTRMQFCDLPECWGQRTVVSYVGASRFARICATWRTSSPSCTEGPIQEVASMADVSNSFERRAPSRRRRNHIVGAQRQSGGYDGSRRIFWR